MTHFHSARTGQGLLLCALAPLLASLASATPPCWASSTPLQSSAVAAAHAELEPRWEDFLGRDRAGHEFAGHLGRIDVPERHERPDGARIELAFVVYPSTSSEPGPPIFFLVGGPGASGTQWCASEASDERTALLSYGDVVGIDQRGTGLTRPNLSQGPAFEFELALDQVPTRAAVAAAHAQAMQACATYWKEQGVDLTAYDSLQSAQDIDCVRRALGAERIVLWGTSYGSHLGLAYLRRHAAQVERAVLMKVEGPDQTWKLPSQVQRGLERLSALVAADEHLGPDMPDLVATLAALLQQLEETPARLSLPPASGMQGELAIGADDLRYAVSSGLAGTTSAVGLPRVLKALSAGNWSLLARAAIERRRGRISSAMAVAMDCASGASPQRRARIARELADPRNLLANLVDPPYEPGSCAACGAPDLGAAYRGPLECDRPLLFVSGDLDVRTPPENVEELRAGCAHAAHILVRGAGHDSRELESDEYLDLLARFLAGDELEDQTIDLPALEFPPLR